MTVFSRIRKIRRRDCTAFLGGIFFASFGYHLYLWFSFMGTQPRQPDAALGLIYSMNNHGWSYYLSATQAIQLGMLFYVFMALIILIAIAHGPNPVKLPWEKYTVAASGSGKYFFGPPPSIYLSWCCGSQAPTWLRYWYPRASSWSPKNATEIAPAIRAAHRAALVRIALLSRY
jgi:hypothetical protein